MSPSQRDFPNQPNYNSTPLLPQPRHSQSPNPIFPHNSLGYNRVSVVTTRNSPTSRPLLGSALLAPSHLSLKARPIPFLERFQNPLPGTKPLAISKVTEPGVSSVQHHIRNLEGAPSACPGQQQGQHGPGKKIGREGRGGRTDARPWPVPIPGVPSRFHFGVDSSCTTDAKCQG